MIQTKLPQFLRNLAWEHSHAMIEVVKWLEALGIVINYKSHILETTAIDIHTRHANDYVELGSGFKDPEGKMFYCFTSQTVEFSVPYEILTSVMVAMKNHRDMGKQRIAENIEIDTDVGNQFTMQKHMLADDWNWEKCTMKIKFHIHHSW